MSLYRFLNANDWIFVTWWEGIFKKVSVFTQIVPKIRVVIFMERNQEIFIF
jgi:hypothetical protein